MRVCIAGFLTAVSLFAQQQATWGSLESALDHFYNLEYDASVAELQRGVAAEPDNAHLRDALAESIQFRELFKVGALESELVTGNNSFIRRPKIDTTPQIEKQFFDQINKAMELSQARLKVNPNDTKALYALGVAYGLRANWNFLVRKAWREALHDATTARQMHDKIIQLDPSNYDAR